MADNIFDEEENDMLEPAALEEEEQPEDQFGDLLEDSVEPLHLPGLDGAEFGLPGADHQPASQPEPEQQQRQPMSDKRAVLLQLAKKAATDEAGSGSGKKKKSKKKDKQQQQEQQRGGSSSRPKRTRQAAGAAEAADGAEGGGSAYQPELPEDQYQETAEDADFIDDAGVPEDERYEEEDVEAFNRAEEAEEAMPGEEEDGEPASIVDEVLKGRKRRKKASDDQIDADVAQLLSQMGAAAKADLRVIEEGQKKPAIAKWQALKNVDELLRQRSHYESFIQQNGLVTMASWLRPYPNGALPLPQIRSTLVELLALMALDTSNDYTREKLEESGLGKVIMFYSQNQHETSMALKTKCRDLILAWSAPIFADVDAEQRKRRIREREHRHRMVQERERVKETEVREKAEAEKRRRANPGEEGFRARAAVPQPSKLDFVINPGSRIDPLDGPRGGLQPGAKSSKPKSPMPEKLAKALAAKKRGTKDRFSGMSVEGRGMIV